VAYATRNGSTGQVAEAIAAVLRDRGLSVEVRPAKTVRESIADRRLVVLGGAIYSGRWLHDAHRFLKRHRRELAEVPVVVFGMGPRTDQQESWQRTRAQLDRALAKHTWLSPAAVAVFGGVDPPKRRRSRPRRDVRDWDSIRTWALQIAALGNGLQE